VQITELAAKVQALGLSDKEAKVYVAALFLGPAPVQKIAEQADVNRATVYVILDQLADLGLVSQSTEGKKTVFVAEGPEALSHLFDRQIEQVAERRKDLEVLLPDLQQNQRAESGAAPMVRFYKGKEGIDALTRELNRRTHSGSTSYTLVNYDEVEKVIPDIFKSRPQARLKKHIASHIIYSYRKEVPSDPRILRQTKRSNDPIKADITLRDDIAAFSTYAGKKSIGVVVESPEIVGALRQLFEMAWDDQQ
jgi:sugar-specific transcriptional regulator TrmB